MRDTNTAAPPAVTRIEAYYPADEATNTAAYLAGFATCEACDGEGHTLGDAHLTTALHVDCEECRRGEVEVELEGDKAEAAYRVWAAADDDEYSIIAYDCCGECDRDGAKGWAAFLPIAQAFGAKYRGTNAMVVGWNDDTNDGERGGNLASWQDEWIQDYSVPAKAEVAA